LGDAILTGCGWANRAEKSLHLFGFAENRVPQKNYELSSFPIKKGYLWLIWIYIWVILIFTIFRHTHFKETR
jgi:hypothetical protein